MQLNQQHAHLKSRLGSILIKDADINQEQLERALAYQEKKGVKLGTALIQLELISHRKLKKALKKQGWVRILATTITILCSPLTSTFATDQLVSDASMQDHLIQPLSYDSHNLNFSQTSEYLDYWLDNIDYSNKNNFLNFSQNKHFNIDVAFELSQPISIFSTVNQSNNDNYTSRTINKGLNRYSNTSPITFMLTLKGRCLMQNSDKVTKMWSLDKVKNKTQRKTQLMFSITKEF